MSNTDDFSKLLENISNSVEKIQETYRLLDNGKIMKEFKDIDVNSLIDKKDIDSYNILKENLTKMEKLLSKNKEVTNTIIDKIKIITGRTIETKPNKEMIDKMNKTFDDFIKPLYYKVENLNEIIEHTIKAQNNDEKLLESMDIKNFNKYLKYKRKYLNLKKKGI